ncbi:hypothetical protein [Streptomyces tubercidicus]|uniref:hypothetical protein n=1 Tax=Streptomyces tubercidicus TaxID=47759 RepID=UPI00368FC5FA
MTLRIEEEDFYYGADLRVYHGDEAFTGEIIDRDPEKARQLWGQPSASGVRGTRTANSPSTPFSALKED